MTSLSAVVLLQIFAPLVSGVDHDDGHKYTKQNNGDDRFHALILNQNVYRAFNAGLTPKQRLITVKSVTLRTVISKACPE